MSPIYFGVWGTCYCGVLGRKGEGNGILFGGVAIFWATADDGRTYKVYLTESAVRRLWHDHTVLYIVTHGQFIDVNMGLPSLLTVILQQLPSGEVRITPALTSSI